MRRMKNHKALERLVAWVAVMFTLAAGMAMWSALTSGFGLQGLVIAISSMGAGEFWGQVRRMRSKRQNSQQQEDEP